MKFYNKNDLMFVFGLIVIVYFSLRYLMTRTLVEGQSEMCQGDHQPGWCTGQPQYIPEVHEDGSHTQSAWEQRYMPKPKDTRPEPQRMRRETVE